MEGSEPGDGILLQGLAAGDSGALLALHKRYVHLVYSMAWRVLQDVGLAEEVTQDVFLKLWQKSQRYDPARGQFPHWLLMVTRFAAIDRCAGKVAAPVRSSCPAKTPMTRRPSSGCCPPIMRPGARAALAAAPGRTPLQQRQASSWPSSAA